MSRELIAKQRRKVETYRGLRKIRAEAELVKLLVDDSNAEALAIAEQSIERARGLLKRAQERAMATGQYESALAWILRAKAQALRNNSRIEDSLQVLDEAMLLFRRTGEERELFHSHLFKHVLFRDRKKLPAARSELEYALELGRQLGMDWEEAEILGDLGTINHFLENYATAREQFEQALERFRVQKERNWHSEVTVIYHLGYVFECTGELNKAIAHYEKALELGKKHPEADLLLVLLHMTWMYAGARISLGETTQALEILEEWGAVSRQATLVYPEASFLELTSKLCISTGRYVKAYRSAARARSLYEGIGNEGGIAMTQVAIGRIYASCGEEDIADIYFSAGITLFDDIYARHRGEDMSMLCTSLSTLAHFASHHIDVDRYLSLLSEKIDNYSLQADKRKDILLRQCVGLLRALKGDADSACAELEKVIEMSIRLGYVEFQCDNRYHLGCLLADRGDIDKAATHLEEALKLAQRSGRRDTERHIHRRLGQLYAKSGDTDKARQHRQSEQSLMDQTYSPQVRLQLKLLHCEAELERNRHDMQHLRTELASAQENAAARQRLLDSKNEHTAHLKKVLGKVAAALRQRDKDSTFRPLIADIEAATADESWQEFEEEVRDHDEAFMQRLLQKYPKLTSAEQRVCALIRINTTTRNLSQMLNVSTRTVQDYRYRIRRKMNLPPDEDLNAAILAI